MQSLYLTYLCNKNHVSADTLAEAIGTSSSAISRIKTGAKEVSKADFDKLILAAGGDTSSYKAFMKAVEDHDKDALIPLIPTEVKSSEKPVSIYTLRDFYNKYVDSITSRYQAELERLTQQHKSEIEGMEKHHSLRISELKEDIYSLKDTIAKKDTEMKELSKKYLKLHNSRGRWRASFCALFGVYLAQWLLDWLVFHDIGFVVHSAFVKPGWISDISVLRG